RQLRAPRGPEHPRAGSMREAGAVRAADGELPGQRAGAGGPRRPASEGSGGAPAADARSAGASGRAAQARRAGARRGLLGAGRLRARCPPDRGAAPVNFWWRSQPPLWSAPLVALSAAWRAGAAIDRAVRRPVKLPVAVISVGNLTVGGAGKTPVTLELAARLAARGRKPAVLSRGYGRRSREPVEVSAGTPADVAGDATGRRRAAPRRRPAAPRARARPRRDRGGRVESVRERAADPRRPPARTRLGAAAGTPRADLAHRVRPDARSPHRCARRVPGRRERLCGGARSPRQAR